MPIKEYTPDELDKIVAKKIYRVDHYSGDHYNGAALLESSLAKVIEIKKMFISFETQKYNPALTKPSKKFNVPTWEPNPTRNHWRIFETGEDITDRILRGQALEQALQSGTMENPTFSEPITNTTKVWAKDLIVGGRKYKTRKTKMHKKKNTTKKMKKKQTRTRRKR